MSGPRWFSYCLHIVATMVWFLLRCLLVVFLHGFTTSSPVSLVEGSPSLQQYGHNLFNLSPVPNDPVSANFSQSDITAVPDPRLPHRFRVPGTSTVLHLGFGLRRTSVEPVYLQSLIWLALSMIEEGIEQNGYHTLYPWAYWRQRFVYSMGEGIRLQISNFQDGRFFSWGELQTAVKGLDLYLLQGRRFYLTRFKFYVGPGPIPDITSNVKGWGAILKDDGR